VIDHEILSKVIHTVPQLWHVQKFQFLAKVKTTSTGKLHDSLPRNSVMALVHVNSMWLNAMIQSENYQYHRHKSKSTVGL
jgi:hypothetical protein